MPIYNYKAKDRYGVPVQGVMEAAASSSVASKLTEMGYTPVYVIEQEISGYSSLEEFFARFSRVRSEEVLVFVRQLSSILEAGVPLLESLEAVYDQVTSYRFKRIVLKIRREIEAGSSFSEALSHEPKVFTPIFYSMVRAGERAGILPEVLERLSALLERDFENTQKIKSATRYPIVLLSSLIVAFLIVVTFVIPRFSQLYATFQSELPLPTRILLGINYVIMHYFVIIILFVGLGYYAALKILETEKGRELWDRFMLSVPVFGTLVSKLMLSRFCRMLAAMLRSGIPVVEALNITKQTVENKIIIKVISDIQEDVIRGGGISEPMRGSKIFPPIAIQMVAIGERAGALESMLNKVADYFDRDADYMIRNLTPLLEPFLILMLAVLVMLLALGVYLPMWNLIKIVKTS